VPAFGQQRGFSWQASQSYLLARYISVALCHAAKQMIPWHIIIEAEIIEQLRRRDLHAHHRLSLLLQNN
jgi:hypothetical protein